MARGGLIAVAAATILAFPSAGSALEGQFPIALTSNGPSPNVANLTAGARSPQWTNQDQVTHTIVFENGFCSLQLAPGEQGSCTNDFFASVGQYPYTVDGTTEASVVVAPNLRTVTLTARSHTIKRGKHLLLHGTLAYGGTGGGPPSRYSSIPVIVLARHDRHQPFQRIAMASEPGSSQSGGFKWQLSIHPKRTTIYIAKATYQPDSGQFWQNATSKPFKVVVRAQNYPSAARR
jgi:hypothetical protein